MGTFSQRVLQNLVISVLSIQSSAPTVYNINTIRGFFFESYFVVAQAFILLFIIGF